MSSTVSKPDGTSWHQSNTTINSTQTTWSNFTMPTPPAPRQPPDWVREPRLRYIPVIGVAIPANLGIIVLILCTKDLRTRPLFLGALSLSIFCLCDAVFTLPMGMEHWLNSLDWQHGDNVCAAYAIMFLIKTYMCSLMNIMLCFERLVAKLRSVGSIGEKLSKTLSNMLIIIPWVVGMVTSVPVLVVKRVEFKQYQKDQIRCVFLLEKDFYMPGVVCLFAVPLTLLLIVSFIMIVVYRLKKTEWSRIAVNTEAESVGLRMSTLGVWIISLVFVGVHAPFTVVVFQILLCNTRSDCLPTLDTYVTSLFLSTVTTAITPFFWLITVEIRTALTSIGTHILSKIGTKKNTNILAWSAVRNTSNTDTSGLV